MVNSSVIQPVILPPLARWPVSLLMSKCLDGAKPYYYYTSRCFVSVALINAVLIKLWCSTSGGFLLLFLYLCLWFVCFQTATEEVPRSSLWPINVNRFQGGPGKCRTSVSLSLVRLDSFRTSCSSFAIFDEGAVLCDVSNKSIWKSTRTGKMRNAYKVFVRTL
jgi:hypothetical protein